MKSLRMFEDPDRSTALKHFSLEQLSSTVENDNLTLKKEDTNQKKPVEKKVSSLKTTNLLLSRKKCEKKSLSIDEIVKVDAKILSFG